MKCDDGVQLGIPEVPNKLQGRSIIDADTSDEDNILLRRVIKRRRLWIKQEVKRSWKQQQLKERSNIKRSKIENTTESAVVQKLRDENLSPIVNFVMFSQKNLLRFYYFY